ncbi:DivIVA domain-containing protein [Streptomyces sp. NPDC058372]|uniref:DivIVA domain-containing protein n=1 Tax=Streptomyces sp. NPDC058372 TaxID=3346464 RepID=UPI00364E7455
MVMFVFLVIALVVVVAAVTLVVVGGGSRAVLPEAGPETVADAFPEDRPLGRADVDALRFPVALRGYRMTEVDDALSRLGAELAERDARIAELESARAGDQAHAVGGAGLLEPPPEPGATEAGPADPRDEGDRR